jgi:peptidoglycan hydrolase-like protein with peptidoglycan-binding domain
MGYCHYFTRLPNQEQKDSYGRLAMDAIAIIREAQKHGIHLGSFRGDEAPEINEGRIVINGVMGPTTYGTLEAFQKVAHMSVSDGSHETFFWEANALPSDDYWNIDEYRQTGRVNNFVKTNEKPYDAVVCALLIAAKDHYGDSVLIGSDGDWESGGWSCEAGWVAGRELYEAALKKPAVYPMTY